VPRGGRRHGQLIGIGLDHIALRAGHSIVQGEAYGFLVAVLVSREETALIRIIARGGVRVNRRKQSSYPCFLRQAAPDNRLSGITASTAALVLSIAAIGVFGW